jgi:hypothetical protein
VGSSTSHKPVGLHGFTLLYADYVLTSQETSLWASTARYRDRFTFLYVDNIRTPQEAHLWFSTERYGDRFTYLYVDDVRTSQQTLLLPSTPVAGTPHRKHTYGPRRPVTEIALFLICR